MAVDLLPFLWVLQDPPVPHHSTADTLGLVAAVLPVVQQPQVSSRAENRQSFLQRCRHTNNRINLDKIYLTNPLSWETDLVAELLCFFCLCNYISPQIQLFVMWSERKKERKKTPPRLHVWAHRQEATIIYMIRSSQAHMSTIKSSKILQVFCLEMFGIHTQFIFCFKQPPVSTQQL